MKQGMEVFQIRMLADVDESWTTWAAQWATEQMQAVRCMLDLKPSEA